MPTSTTAKKPTSKLSVVATSKPKPVTATPKKTAVKKAASRNPKAKSNGAAVPDEQRRHYVEVAAYYIAERRGFLGGSELEDWTQAELEVDRLLRENRLNS